MSVIERDELVHQIACALSYYCDGDVGEAENWRGAAEAVAVVVLEGRQPRGAVSRIDAALKIIEAERAADGNLQMGRAKASQVIELLRSAGGQ
jgi:hypothetical protein